MSEPKNTYLDNPTFPDPNRWELEVAPLSPSTCPCAKTLFAKNAIVLAYREWFAARAEVRHHLTEVSDPYSHKEVERLTIAIRRKRAARADLVKLGEKL